MKIKFCSDYCSSEALKKRIELVCVGGGHSFPEFEIVTGDTYDYLIVFNGSDELKKEDKEKTIAFIQEPSWMPTLKRDLPEYCKRVFTHEVKMFPGYSNVEYHHSVIFYHDSDHRYGNSPRTIYDEDNGFDKPKKLSMIVSSKSDRREGAIYDKRRLLVDRIMKSDLDIDIYGHGWDLEDPRYKGELRSKRPGLRPYEYSIAIENSNELGYCTEKMGECFLNNTVPLYWGAPNVDKIYDAQSFHIINPDHENVIDNIKEIIAKSSHEYERAVLQAKDDYLNKYNLLNVLKKVLL